MYRQVPALLDKLHHQIVIRDTEGAKAAQSRAGIHQEIEQHLWMNELDLIDQIEFPQQHAAYEAIEVATGDKPKL